MFSSAVLDYSRVEPDVASANNCPRPRSVVITEVSRSPSPPGPVFCGQCCFLLPILFLFGYELSCVASLPSVEGVVPEAGGGDGEDVCVTVIVGGEVANAASQAHHSSPLLSVACYERRPITANNCLSFGPFLRHRRR